MIETRIPFVQARTCRIRDGLNAGLRGLLAILFQYGWSFADAWTAASTAPSLNECEDANFPLWETPVLRSYLFSSYNQLSWHLMYQGYPNRC